MKVLRQSRALAVLAGLFACCSPAAADELRNGGKLLLTNGISSIEGSAGGGITPWAVIAGNATKDGIGAQASYTIVEVAEYDFQSASIAIGAFDRIELSFARQNLNTNEIGGVLGIGNDYAFDQDIYGVKLRLAGDIVYGPEIMPAIAIGVQHKKNLDAPIVRAIGAADSEGTDFYVTATKLFLSRSVLASATLRLTRANQGGLLGFGGDGNDDYTFQPEVSLAYQLSRRLVIGAEYRSKPDNLGTAREDDWGDGFVAYALNRNLTATFAYTDLGSVATVEGQRGVLFQLQAGF